MIFLGPRCLLSIGHGSKVWVARFVTHTLWLELAAWPGRVSALLPGFYWRRFGPLLVTKRVGISLALAIGSPDSLHASRGATR